MPGRTDACGTVNGEPGVASVGSNSLAGVYPHAYTNVRAARPPVGQERELPFHRRAHRVTGAQEGDEKRVALSIDFVAAMVREGGAE